MIFQSLPYCSLNNQSSSHRPPRPCGPEKEEGRRSTSPLQFVGYDRLHGWTQPIWSSLFLLVIAHAPKANSAGKSGSKAFPNELDTVVVEPYIGAAPQLPFGVFVGAGVFVGGTGVSVGGTGVSVGGSGVSVGGAGVSVGGTGVSVGGTGVSVGGAGVSVGGTGVSVGGIGVSVGGSGVSVSTGVSVGGTGVSVGGTGVSVGGTGVSVGGTGVSVGGTGVLVGAGPLTVTLSKVAVQTVPSACDVTGRPT